MEVNLQLRRRSWMKFGNGSRVDGVFPVMPAITEKRLDVLEQRIPGGQ
jgi:hypothetical protein